MPYRDNSSHRSAFESSGALPEKYSGDYISRIVSYCYRRANVIMNYMSKNENLVTILFSILFGFVLHMIISRRRTPVIDGDTRRPRSWKYIWDAVLGLSGISISSQTNKNYKLEKSGKTCKNISRSEHSSSCNDGPKHVAVIMDGNRRFGREQHNDPLQGHWVGGQTLVNFIQWCMEEGVDTATVYAFSTENWARDPAEINALMTIFAKYAEQLTTEALERNVRVCVLSTDFEKLPPAVQTSLDRLMAATQRCTAFTANICVSYGGRAEILSACSKIATEAARGVMGAGGDDISISESQFKAHLSTGHSSDPDLLIRTSGEYRLSNFLLWQLAYTELFFLNKYWPEITQEDLRTILKQYKDRNRRYGC